YRGSAPPPAAEPPESPPSQKHLPGLSAPSTSEATTRFAGAPASPLTKAIQVSILPLSPPADLQKEAQCLPDGLGLVVPCVYFHDTKRRQVVRLDTRPAGRIDYLL
ncbi:MAG: hypothetical protein ABSB94_19410, partial [Syntrophorhabdales bacterium]